jgi:hypothetical protein
MADVSETFCHRCGALLHPGRGDFFLIKIEAFSDPSPPIITPPELSGEESTSLAALARDLEKYSERELMDYVYRKLTLTLCNRCYRGWIENPAG